MQNVFGVFIFDKTRANDKDYMLKAVSQQWWALEDASPELQNDADIIKATEYDEDEEYDEDKYIDTCDPDYLDI